MAWYLAHKARVHCSWRVERMFDGQKLLAARVKSFFGCSWLGYARDWLFCHSMPLLWQLDEQKDEI